MKIANPYSGGKAERKANIPYMIVMTTIKVGVVLLFHNDFAHHTWLDWAMIAGLILATFVLSPYLKYGVRWLKEKWQPRSENKTANSYDVIDAELS